jgi:hypothetical protein
VAELLECKEGFSYGFPWDKFSERCRPLRVDAAGAAATVTINRKAT